MNLTASVDAAQIGQALGMMPPPDAERLIAVLGESIDDSAVMAQLKIARAEASEKSGQEARAANFAPMDFDFDADPDPPDWIIDGLIERATVNVCSGDTGSAKSIHWLDATVRLLHGEPWLDRSISRPYRVLYLDEENPERITKTRLKALGTTNADRENLRYYRREGIRIGDPASAATRWLHEECEKFKPDVLVIDTAMAATDAEVNDNDSVVALYSQTLRPLAERHGLAVVILHHERKPQAGETRNAGFAMMGARQWAGQADVHMTLARNGGYSATPLEAGEATEHAFTFSVAKARDGYSSVDERTVVRGVKLPNDDGGPWRLVSLRVDWEGKITSGTADGEIADEILRKWLADDPDSAWGAKDAAAACGKKTDDGTFKRAWKSLSEGARPLVEMTGNASARKGKLTERGRERAEAIGSDA